MLVSFFPLRATRRLNDEIDDLAAKGGTAGQIGTAWA